MKFLNISILAIAILFCTFANATCPTENISLESQTEVDNFRANYPGCTTIPVGVTLKVKGSDITNLDSLRSLITIDGQLLIEWCPNLVDITGLTNLTTVNGELQFDECHALTSFNGLQNLTTCHDIEIKGMDALTDISQLSGLTALSGELNIKDCDALINLTGLHNISSIGNSMRLDGNRDLMDLSALSSLTSVGGSVYILNNRNLPNLNGLDNLVSIGNNLDVYRNESLADCVGVCKALNAVTAPGTPDIRDNAIGSHCDNINILETECLFALPVELTDFRAKEDAKNKTVVLSWTTASELDNKHFEVERSVDGRHFETLATVAGNGTTTTKNYYNFVDKNPVAMAYYRLKQVDFANAFSYSDIVLVELAEDEVAQVVAFPTMATDEITVRFSGFDARKGTYKIFNMQGMLLHSETVDLSSKAAYRSLDISKFENGIYTIIISDNSNHVSTNFVIAK